MISAPVSLPRHRKRRLLAVFWFLFRRAWVAAYKDNCFGMAKGAAYSGLVGLFPMLTSLAAILVQANGQAIALSLSQLLYEAVPPGAESIVVNRLIVQGERPASLLIGATALSLWAASGLMISLMQGFEKAYRVKETRSFIHQRLVAISLVIATAFPVVSASALLLSGGRAEQQLLTITGVLPRGQELVGSIRLVSMVVRYAVIVAALVLATAVLYYFGPHRTRRWRYVWPGSALCTGLWFATTYVFSWYVRNVANYNVMYGSIGVVIALLVWMYLLSVIALYGCEFNAQRERLMRIGRTPILET